MRPPGGDDASAAAALSRIQELAAAEDRTAQDRALAQAAERFPGERAVQVRAASLLHEADPDVARRSLERASELEPSDPDTLTQCASAAFDLRDLPLAAEYAQRAYEAAPEGDFALAGGLLHLFGRLQLEKGEYARAETSLRLAFERDPDPPGFGRALALKLCEQGRDAEALEVVGEALRHLPDDPSLMALQAGLSAGDAPDDPIRRERRRAVRRERRGRHRG